MRPSLKDVALRAGVSPMTVSNVVNGRPGVTPETRDKVLRAIKATGYTRNASARQLRLGHSQTFAVLVQDPVNPFYADFVEGVDEAASEAGVMTTVMAGRDDVARERQLVALMLEQHPRGAIVAVTSHWQELSRDLRRLVDAGIATSALGNREAWPRGCTVCGDDRSGGELVGRHLADRGHRQVAFVGVPAPGAWAWRLEGLRAGLAQAGASVCVEPVPTPGASIEDGRTAGSLIARMAERPTAVACVNDLVALGVLRSLVDAGLRVPQDIAVVGYDDIPFAEGAVIPLSSVRQSARLMGRRAASMLLTAVAEGDEHQHRHEVQPPALVVRRSSGG